MTDLKMIDELLCALRQSYKMSWQELEESSLLAREAIHRLRVAWKSGEMPIITLGLANYLRNHESKRTG